MQEFSSVTASSYDADSLAPMLSEKAQEGWSIVSIVAAGTNVVAYLSRETDAPDAEPTPVNEAEAPAPEPIAADPADAPTQAFTPAASAVEEPAGWGAVDEGPAAMETTADADTSSDDAATDVGTAVTGAAALTDLNTDDATSDAGDVPAAVENDATVSTEPDTAAEPEAAAAAPAEEATPEAPPADAGVPAGWYADPSGRYELRYWDGAAWTEHVSRAGQQYTDPPVA